MPILVYHSISTNLFGLSHPYYQINTSPEIFSTQMRWLRNAGYHSVDLPEMVDGLSNAQDMSKRVVITFDDGYRDVFTHGLPIMKQCGLTATIFLATDRIHETPMRFEGVDYLTWQDVRELHKEGMSFGSHTVTHPDLRSMEPEQIDYELGYSKEVIEQKLGVAVESFSYPFPFPEEDRDFARFLGDTLENHGFKNGVSNIIGRAHRDSNPYFLPRLGVNSWDNLELLKAKLLGGYDWMHIPQWFHKLVNHNVTMMQGSGRQA
ncbi:MAG TPA: polysaccharide deacetylase family protein [Candidatus Dormibacteraeota bacterium]|nr:polysaccharide deacetylase family protein [Candidatus Dormibacteraeota bacterium]